MSSATVWWVSQPRQRTSRYVYPALSASPSVSDGCAGPLKASMRLVQASQASLSASRRASAARSAAMRRRAVGFGQAATIRGSTEAYYQTGGVKQRISCPVDYLELLRRSAQHLMRVFAEKQRVVFN